MNGAQQSPGIANASGDAGSYHHYRKLSLYHRLDRRGLLQPAKAAGERPDEEPRPSFAAPATAFLVPCSASHSTRTVTSFVGKGTVHELKCEQRHEAAMYRHMHRLQGYAIPLLIGSLNLASPMPKDNVIIARIVFLSWGDNEAGRFADVLLPTFLHEACRSLREVQLAGVLHNGEAERNILWGGGLQRAVVIDFDRSVLLRGQRLRNEDRSSRRAQRKKQRMTLAAIAAAVKLPTKSSFESTAAVNQSRRLCWWS
jgi:hypothetical protein